VRRAVFWLHLLVGVTAGAVILFMSLTGVLLAFEPQLTEWLERDRRVVTPPVDARRLTVDAVLARAREARPALPPITVTRRSDPAAAAVVSFGREGGALFVDPYRGTVLGGLSRTHEVLHVVVEWHRWLGSRDFGRPVTGAANLGFAGLVVLGVYLWWPRRWTREAVRQRTVLGTRLRGHARDFNWHHAIGIWCAPVLLVLTLTGAVMSYQWANDLLYTLTGNEPPPPPPAREAARRPRTAADNPGGTAAALEPLWARAEAQVPGWIAITLRLPPSAGAPVVFVIQEPGGAHPAPRSQLALDPRSGEVVRWEPYAGQNLGRRLRAWVRPLHTGEAGGPIGQLIALAAAGGGAVLAWTGLALAWRRWRRWRRSRVPVDLPAPRPGQEVSAN
jgi:uncharacterized iron-regulated membrane protein